jgi:hypothetical protein
MRLTQTGEKISKDIKCVMHYLEEGVKVPSDNYRVIVCVTYRGRLLTRSQFTCPLVVRM